MLSPLPSAWKALWECQRTYPNFVEGSFPRPNVFKEKNSNIDDKTCWEKHASANMRDVVETKVGKYVKFVVEEMFTNGREARMIEKTSLLS